MANQSRIPLTLVLALAFTMMLGPFSLDTYLPAFPDIANTLGVELQSISLSISVYIFALALGQLVGGALSDRYGRQLILLTGLVMFAVASFILSQVETLTMLLSGRVVQAFGAGWVLVSVPALVRDRIQGQQAAKLFSLIGMIMVVAPAIAPSVGSLLLKVGPWGGIFIFQTVYAVALIPLLMRTVFRGEPSNRSSDVPVIGVLERYRSVFRTKDALSYIIWQAAAFSAMMLFITHSSFIYQIHFQQSADNFALLFGANIVTMLGFNVLNRLLSSRVSSLRVLQLATACQAVGLIALVAAVSLGWSLYAFLPAMMLTVGAMGAISPNIMACYLEYFPASSGTAAALLGAAQFGVAGVLGGISSLLPHTVLVIVLVMAGCSVISVGLMLASLRVKTP